MPVRLPSLYQARAQSQQTQGNLTPAPTPAPAPPRNDTYCLYPYMRLNHDPLHFPPFPIAGLQVREVEKRRELLSQCCIQE